MLSWKTNIAGKFSCEFPVYPLNKQSDSFFVIKLGYSFFSLLWWPKGNINFLLEIRHVCFLPLLPACEKENTLNLCFFFGDDVQNCAVKTFLFYKNKYTDKPSISDSVSVVCVVYLYARGLKWRKREHSFKLNFRLPETRLFSTTLQIIITSFWFIRLAPETVNK